MNNKRPRIKVPFETVDIIVEFRRGTHGGRRRRHCIINYMQLPDAIATHGLEGRRR